MYESLAPNELVERYREGDREAACELFNRYVARLIGLVRPRLSPQLARRVDPDDIVQSTFRSFFSAVDRGQFSFDDAGDLWRLLTVMALNKLRRNAEFHYAGKRCVATEQQMAGDRDDPRSVASEHFDIVATQPLPDAEAAMMEEYELLVKDLDPIQLEMVRMRMEGYQLEEIAVSVQRSERTVRRVLERLRERWAERAEAA